MTLLETFLDQPAWRIIDHTEFGTNFAALDSFAIDDTLCAAVGANESEAVARFWVHDATVVLGIQDSRLPFVSEALAELEGRGYHTLVRSSGGLAVVLDAAVLNVSLIAPAPDVFGGIDFGYETMWQLVREMILPFGKGVATGEIVGSYCPGRYDLSIGGRKFGGISQRRTRGGMAVQAFLLAAGSGAAWPCRHFCSPQGQVRRARRSCATFMIALTGNGRRPSITRVFARKRWPPSLNYSRRT